MHMHALKNTGSIDTWQHNSYITAFKENSATYPKNFLAFVNKSLRQVLPSTQHKYNTVSK